MAKSREPEFISVPKEFVDKRGVVGQSFGKDMYYILSSSEYERLVNERNSSQLFDIDNKQIDVMLKKLIETDVYYSPEPVAD